MRHSKKFNHLKRKSAHRKALLRNLAISLITHKRIVTTLAKAKALRQFIEPLVTKSKNNTTHSQRVVFSYLQNKDAVKELFVSIAGKVGDRPGGYVRVIKTGFRRGDAAEMAMIEFVDYNDVYSTSDSSEEGANKKTRRRRRGGGGGKKSNQDTAQNTEETAVEAADEAENTATEQDAEAEDKKED